MMVSSIDSGALNPPRSQSVSPVVGIRYGWCGSWGYQNDALEELGAGGFGGGVPSDGVPTGGTPTLADDELELGLLHIGARYYSPDIGRFVQRDPISVRGGINLYVYAGNFPATTVDRNGWFSFGGLLEHLNNRAAACRV